MVSSGNATILAAPYDSNDRGQPTTPAILLIRHYQAARLFGHLQLSQAGASAGGLQHGREYGEPLGFDHRGLARA
jgi:hypothetical protein